MGGRGASSGTIGAVRSNMLASVQNDEQEKKVIRLPIEGLTAFDKNGNPNKEKTIDLFEERHADLLDEYAVFVDENGNALAYFMGKGKNIRLGEKIFGEIKAPMQTTLVHNHPLLMEGMSIGGTFSDTDIATMAWNGIGTIMATAAEGRYTMRATFDADPVEFARATTEKADAFLGQAKARYDIETESGKAAALKYIDKALHKWYSENAVKYGYEYTFEGR